MCTSARSRPGCSGLAHPICTLSTECDPRVEVRAIPGERWCNHGSDPPLLPLMAATMYSPLRPMAAGAAPSRAGTPHPGQARTLGGASMAKLCHNPPPPPAIRPILRPPCASRSPLACRIEVPGDGDLPPLEQAAQSV